MIARNPRLGNGIYRIADVARYTGVHPNTLRSWFNSRRLFAPEFIPISDTTSISFLDMLDSRVASFFRKSGVKMSVVRHAYEQLKHKLDTRHPFCHRDVYTDGRSIIYDAAQQLGERMLLDAVNDQQLFDHIREHLDQIEFAQLSHIAERWFIDKGVVVDPRVAMGQPVVIGTGVTTWTLSNAYHANDGDAAFVGGMFMVSASQVKDAVAFEERIQKAA